MNIKEIADTILDEAKIKTAIHKACGKPFNLPSRMPKVQRFEHEGKSYTMAVIHNPSCGCPEPLKVRVSNWSPSIGTLNKWASDGVAKALDGCKVEPDGTCIHGHDSWLRHLGYI